VAVCVLAYRYEYRFETCGCVTAGARVVFERSETSSRIEAARRIQKRRGSTGGCIAAASSVARERCPTEGHFSSPVMLLESAPDPVTVLVLPVVFVQKRVLI